MLFVKLFFVHIILKTIIYAFFEFVAAGIIYETVIQFDIKIYFCVVIITLLRNLAQFNRKFYREPMSKLFNIQKYNSNRQALIIITDNCHNIRNTSVYKLMEIYNNSVFVFDNEKWKEITQWLIHTKGCYDVLNIILQTHGGCSEDADEITSRLLHFEGKINIHIPMYAYSAGTQLALCGHTIYMNQYAALSPCDSIGNKDIQCSITGNIDIKLLKEPTLNDAQLIAMAKSKSDFDKQTIEKIIKERYPQHNQENINKIVDDFASGKTPHSRTFGVNDLKEYNLNVKTDINREICDFMKYMNQL